MGVVAAVVPVVVVAVAVTWQQRPHRVRHAVLDDVDEERGNEHRIIMVLRKVVNWRNKTIKDMNIGASNQNSKGEYFYENSR